MTSIADFCLSLNALQTALPTLVHESLIDTRQVAIDRQKAQLMAGVDNTETPIAPPYSPAYARTKRQLGLQYNKVDGYLSGSMYNQMEDVIEQTTFTLRSTSYTFGKFIARYGENTFGLTLRSLEVVRDATEPVLIDKVKNYLGV